MTDSRTAAGLDRLPWLSDEPKPQPRPRGRDLLGWIVAAILLLAGASYWLGMRSAGTDTRSVQPARVSNPTTTVPLPQPRAAEPAQPQVETEAMPEVEPVAAPPMPKVEDVRRPAKSELSKPAGRVEQAPAAETTVEAPAEQQSAAPAKTSKVAAESKAKADPLRPWPARVVEGASGRLVRVGTFATARQAKKGWWAIMRMNPALKRLPALVVPVQSLRNGRTYYRLQMGTTSQAHSEVLCQRMRMIGQSCVVIEVYNRGQAEPAE
jgi:outer membrane biosynthesis protein TonB